MTYDDPQPLTGKGLAAFQHPGRFIDVYEGAVRSGKTFGTLLEWALLIRTGPPGLLAMCGRTERTIITNLLIPMQQMFGVDEVTWSTGAGSATIFGRRVNLYGANDESSLTKIQGSEFAGAYVDEAAVLPESFFSMLVTRLSVPGARMIATCNPAGPRHWFLLKWLTRASLWITGDGEVLTDEDAASSDKGPMDGLHRFTFVIDDNETLAPQYVADQKAAHTGVFYQRYILGRWVAAEGAIYDGFDADRHVIAHEDLPAMTAYLALGADYGTNSNTRGELLAIGPSPIDGLPSLFVVDEWAPDGKRGSRAATSEEQAAHLAEWCQHRERPRSFYADPAANDFRSAMHKHGIRPVHKAGNSVVPGIRTVASLFAANRLFISDRCKHLLAEIPGYVWDQKAADRGEDKPVKENDHACDALRYAVYSSHHWWQQAVGVAAAAPDSDDEDG